MRRALGWMTAFSVGSATGTASASGISLDKSGFRFVFNGVATVVAAGGILAVWLGYRLFTRGIAKGHGTLSAKAKLASLVFSGVGPGLFFMAFGALILISVVVFGAAVNLG